MPSSLPRSRRVRPLATAAAVAVCAGLLAGLPAAWAEPAPDRPTGPVVGAEQSALSKAEPRSTRRSSPPAEAEAVRSERLPRSTGRSAPTPAQDAGDKHEPDVRRGDAAPQERARRGTREQADRRRKDAEEPAAPNPNCTLIVPPAPLTAAGLATTYRLTATDPDQGRCHEADPGQSAFVEATILDPASGRLSIYRPLVVDEGTEPAAPVIPPTLPTGAVVGLWFGFQGDVLTLRNAGGQCVNGLPGSPFGQFAYCGAAEFFAAAQKAIAAGKLTVPTLGTADDGLPCPSTRDFAVVDQDQSDNLTSTYLVLPDGRTAQDTAANAGLREAKRLTNASDNGLLVRSIDPALGCTPFTAPDLTAGGTRSTSLALNELQAAAHQGEPVALIPPNDPMVLLRDRSSTTKTDLYRAGADMPALNPDAETGAAYCGNLATVAARRLQLDRDAFTAAPSPDPDTAKTLYDFLVQRLKTSWEELDCKALTNDGPPRLPGAGDQ